MVQRPFSQDSTVKCTASNLNLVVNCKFLQSIHENYCHFSTDGPILLCDHSISSSFKVVLIYALLVSSWRPKIARKTGEGQGLTFQKLNEVSHLFPKPFLGVNTLKLPSGKPLTRHIPTTGLTGGDYTIVLLTYL